MTGLFNVWSYVGESSVVPLSLFGGVKFPTGNSDRLGEELDEGHHSAGGDADGGEVQERGVTEEHAHDGEGDVQRVARHVHDGIDDEEDAASGIHGHDLALGSVSYDGIVGRRLFASWQRAFLSGTVQYTTTTAGDFDYAYANGLTWSGGPGIYPWLGDDSTLGLMAVLSGQAKGNDEVDGVTLDDTAITSLFVGPGLLFTWISPEISPSSRTILRCRSWPISGSAAVRYGASERAGSSQRGLPGSLPATERGASSTRTTWPLSAERTAASATRSDRRPSSRSGATAVSL